jgi:hypothetical protein
MPPQPSAKREGFATVPDVTWHDVGALSAVREELSLSLLEPIAHPERFARLGLRSGIAHTRSVEADVFYMQQSASCIMHHASHH